MHNAEFKYTISIEKAEQRADGYYIVGIASGPGVDLQGEEMDPQAITGFAAQIEDAVAKGEPIPYMDHHQKGGVLNQLGDVVKGWVTDAFELGIEVRLDEDNPAAMTLWKKVNKGKKYGMSVAGRVGKYIDQFRPEIGKSVRRFYEVALGEISNTTRPVWTPSFGTVLSKAIDDAVAESGASSGGDTPLSKELPVEQADPAADENTEKAEESAPAESESTDTTEKGDAETPADDTTEKADDASAEEDVEKAGRALSAKSVQTLLAMRANIDAALTELGVIETSAAAEDAAPAEKSVSQDDDADALTKAITDATAPLMTKVDELTESLRKATERISELENTAPDGGAPALIDKAENDEAAQVADLLAKAQPLDRIRLGLVARHGQR